MQQAELVEQMERILVVDDDAALRRSLVKALAARGYKVKGAGNLQELAEVLVDFIPNAAVLDLKLADASGLEVLACLKLKFPEIKVVVLTGYGSIATALEAIRKGALHYLTKPSDADQILSALIHGPESASKASSEVPPVPSLSQVEWDHIQRIMVDCGGNVSKASKALGIHRRSLQRKLSKSPGPIH